MSKLINLAQSAINNELVQGIEEDIISNLLKN